MIIFWQVNISLNRHYVNFSLFFIEICISDSFILPIYLFPTTPLACSLDSVVFFLYQNFLSLMLFSLSPILSIMYFFPEYFNIFVCLSSLSSIVVLVLPASQSVPLAGWVQSPGYPRGYDPDSSLNWTECAPAGLKTTLTLTHLDLEEAYDCENDFLKVCMSAYRTVKVWVLKMSNTLYS